MEAVFIDEPLHFETSDKLFLKWPNNTLAHDLLINRSHVDL